MSEPVTIKGRDVIGVPGEHGYLVSTTPTGHVLFGVLHDGILIVNDPLEPDDAEALAGMLTREAEKARLRRS